MNDASMNSINQLKGMYELMPAEAKEELANIIRKEEIDVDSILDEVRFNIYKGNHDHAVQVIKKSDHLMELRSMISVADGRDDYLKKAMEIIKEHLDEEGCTNFEIIISMEDPVRNRCGGKLSRYVEE